MKLKVVIFLTILTSFCRADEFFISGSVDKTLRYWRISDGNCLRILDHPSFVSQTVFTTNNEYILTGTTAPEQALRLWNIRTGELLYTFFGHLSCINCIAVTKNIKYAYTASGDKRIGYWDIENRTLLKMIKAHEKGIMSICLSRDETRLLSSSGDLDQSIIKIWKVPEFMCLKVISGHKSNVSSVSFMPDQEHIITSSWDKTMKLWRISDGQCIRTFTGHTDRINKAEISPAGDYVISASSDCTLKMWNIEDGTVIRTFTGHEGSVSSLSISSDGSYFASASYDGTIKYWNINNDRSIRTFWGHSREINDVDMDIGNTSFETQYKTDIKPIGLKIFPNPFSDVLNINSDGEKKVFDITGKLFAELGKGNRKLNTSSWKKGLYFIKTCNSSFRAVKL
ncbi:MAG: T9SS type A sorting domain-containing protein [Candidatus Coatesbacteria bacterium]|nr:T9SS type A sorting domain-containing protein [Candidatus Coatesbacteria bacterium]